MTSQTPEQRPFARFLRILHYFLMWGLDYGFIFGFAAGSMVLPMFGTIVGSFFGIFIGGLYGLLIGLGIGLTHKDITPETDLDAYGRQLVRRTAGAITGVNVIALFFVIAIVQRELIAQSQLIRFYNPYPVMALIAGLSLLSILISLVVSATARHFPHLLAHEQRLNAPMSHAFVMRHEMETAFHQLHQRTQQRWVWPLVFGVAAAAFLLSPAGQYPNARDWLNALVLGVPLTILGVWVGRIYLSLVNAAVLTFIKRVFLRDYFPNLTGAAYRARVTLMAFVATWAASWWSFFAAPFTALLMAYFVYQTVALPDEMQEKSKRKEAAASQAPSTHRLEEHSDDGEIIDLNRLVDPSSLQQKA